MDPAADRLRFGFRQRRTFPAETPTERIVAGTSVQWAQRGEDAGSCPHSLVDSRVFPSFRSVKPLRARAHQYIILIGDQSLSLHETSERLYKPFSLPTFVAVTAGRIRRRLS